MKDRNLTRGPIVRNLLLFALPMMGGNLFQQLYTVADALIVGRCLGADALAAVGAAYALLVFLNSVLIGLCMGSGALLSEYRGRGDGAAFRGCVWHSAWFIAGVTVMLELLVFLGSRGIFRLLRVPGELESMTRAYCLPLFGSLALVALYNFGAFLLRSAGNARVPFRFLAAASVVNVALDLLFLRGLSLGIAWAAWATVFAQTISAVGLFLYILLRRRDLLPRGRERSFRWSGLREVAVSGLLTGMQQSVMNFGILLIQSLVNSFGPVVMAAFAAGVKLDTFAYMPAQELGNAYSLFISANYGAGEERRVREGTRAAMGITVLFCACVSVLVCAFPEPLIRLFLREENPELLAVGRLYLRTEGAAYVGIGILFLLYGYFRAVRRPGVSLLLTGISLGTRVLLAYTLAPNTSLGSAAIWLAIPIGWALADITGWFLLRRERSRRSLQKSAAPCP